MEVPAVITPLPFRCNRKQVAVRRRLVPLQRTSPRWLLSAWKPQMYMRRRASLVRQVQLRLPITTVLKMISRPLLLSFIPAEVELLRLRDIR